MIKNIEPTGRIEISGTYKLIPIPQIGPNNGDLPISDTTNSNVSVTPTSIVFPKGKNNNAEGIPTSIDADILGEEFDQPVKVNTNTDENDETLRQEFDQPVNDSNNSLQSQNVISLNNTSNNSNSVTKKRKDISREAAKKGRTRRQNKLKTEFKNRLPKPTAEVDTSLDSSLSNNKPKNSKRLTYKPANEQAPIIDSATGNRYDTLPNKLGDFGGKRIQKKRISKQKKLSKRNKLNKRKNKSKRVKK
jgi:hypothetical protein